LIDKNIDNYNINDLIATLQNNLKAQYIKVFSYDDADAKLIVRAIIAHIILNFNKPIPNTNLTPDSIIITGMLCLKERAALIMMDIS